MHLVLCLWLGGQGRSERIESGRVTCFNPPFWLALAASRRQVNSLFSTRRLRWRLRVDSARLNLVLCNRLNTVICFVPNVKTVSHASIIRNLMLTFYLKMSNLREHDNLTFFLENTSLSAHLGFNVEKMENVFKTFSSLCATAGWLMPCGKLVGGGLDPATTMRIVGW